MKSINQDSPTHHLKPNLEHQLKNSGVLLFKLLPLEVQTSTVRDVKDDGSTLAATLASENTNSNKQTERCGEINELFVEVWRSIEPERSASRTGATGSTCRNTTRNAYGTKQVLNGCRIKELRSKAYPLHRCFGFRIDASAHVHQQHEVIQKRVSEIMRMI
jgi:hypothetical protein